MLTFLIGLSLGTCIGAIAVGICRASYEHEAAATEEAAPAKRPAAAR